MNPNHISELSNKIIDPPVLKLPIAQSDLDQLTEALSGKGREPWDYAIAAGIVVGAVIVGRIARQIVRKLISRSRADNLVADLVGRLIHYVILIFGAIYALDTLGIAIGPILGALGIVGIALAFAFQDILENFVAGIILQVQRPFSSGDEIITGDHEGTITAVDTRTITLRTPDGETVRVPSSAVIKNPIVNHSEHGRRRTSISVGVAYGSDLDKASSVALDAARSVDTVYSTPPPEVFIEAFGASSIDLVVRYWHGPSIANEWAVRSAVSKSISRAFADNEINIPFPQRVVHVQPSDLPDNAVLSVD